ncbi:HLH-domain-containing protein, partial [Leucogyrophana mollusca]
MSYSVVRQDGFQLPSPAHTTSSASPSETATASPPANTDLFMPHNISFLPESFRKFPSAAAAHPPPTANVDFSDELATLIAADQHQQSHERSTHSPNPDPYRHNIFDISAPQQSMYPHPDLHTHTHTHFNSTLPALNSSMRYEPHPDPPQNFAYRHTPSPHESRSRSRSRAPSVGPTRTARRDRRANSISSTQQCASPPPQSPQNHRPHPHAILIPGRAPSSSLGNWYGSYLSGPAGEYSLPTPESLTHSFAPQYASNPVWGAPYGAGRVGSPSMGISPTEVSSLGMHHLVGTPTSSVPGTSLPTTIQSNAPSSLPLHPSIAQSQAKASAAKSPVSPTDDTPPSTSLLSEKRRRRRESHNAVERRRRDNINERIGELAGLIPGVLFECDAPLAPPLASPSGPGPNSDELFSLLPDGLALLPDGTWNMNMSMDGALGDLPEEGVKKDPSDDGVDASAPGANGSANGSGGGGGGGVGGTGVGNGTGMGAGNGTAEPQTIKANKGMILRKSVEYIRYLQQLVGVQASRGRELEERNRALEREVAGLRAQGGGSALSLPPSSAQTQSQVQTQAQIQAQSQQIQAQQTQQAQAQAQAQSKQPGLARKNSHRKEWTYELESMPEDMEVEGDDQGGYPEERGEGQI